MRRTILPALALLLASSAGMAGCAGDAPSGLDPVDEPLLAQHEGGGHGDAGVLTPEHRRQLAALRNLTAPFHDVEAAMEAGWSVPLTPCMAHPTDGAMGIHYGNVGLIDGVVELLGPETLLYEPRRNGGLRLVGLEYLVPFDILPADADAPELLGKHFHPNHDAGVWALHVWLWRHNPEGLFADWNANVTCDWAD